MDAPTREALLDALKALVQACEDIPWYMTWWKRHRDTFGLAYDVLDRERRARTLLNFARMEGEAQ